LSLHHFVEIIDNPFLRERPSATYVSSLARLRPLHLARIQEVTHHHPFWSAAVEAPPTED
jgi:hypothetical protein